MPRLGGWLGELSSSLRVVCTGSAMLGLQSIKNTVASLVADHSRCAAMSSSSLSRSAHPEPLRPYASVSAILSGEGALSSRPDDLEVLTTCVRGGCDACACRQCRRTRARACVP